MSYLWFDPRTYTVSCESETVTLLAKEFALLQFLYDNRNQVYTREQLLDHVWPSEYPVERTVDDHVYRIRKKLGRIPAVAINTVRGYGYSLTLLERRNPFNPSIKDEEMKKAVRGMFKKYHLFGQGKSMLTLAAQQEVLGIEVDALYQVYMRFIQGDIEWFMYTGEVPMAERLFWLLLVYSYMAEPHKSLALFEKALVSGVMPDDQKREMYLLNIVDLYAETGRFDEAEERLRITNRTVEEDNLVGFRMPVAIAQMYVLVVKGDMVSAERMVHELEQMLQKAPYLREIGRFQIIKSLWLLGLGQTREAAKAIDLGLNVLRQSRNVPLTIVSVRQVLLYLDRMSELHPEQEQLKRKMEALHVELDREYGITRFCEETDSMLTQYLDSFSI
jgi:DNA-binding winged helix-turn-helix (wHTH) protein